MWRDVLLMAITIYLMRQWYGRHYRLIHGEPKYERVETKDGGYADVFLGFDRWSGVRKLFSRAA